MQSFNVSIQPEILALSEASILHTTQISPFGTVMAESKNDGITCRTLSKLSKKFGIYVVGGSIIERQRAYPYIIHQLYAIEMVN